MKIKSSIRMNNGVRIPCLGLGTYGLTGKKGKQAIQWALDAGYRHFDSASIYGNEQEIGKVIVRNLDLIPREDLFITSKVWGSDLGKKTNKAFQKSLSNFNLDYLDLYLIHWPGSNKQGRIEAWKAMEDLYNEGKIKAIGVSNFSPQEITELMDNSKTIPSINQIHFSPYTFKKRVLEFCQMNDIILEAYTPLEKGRKSKDPLLVKIAEKYNKTPAQILIRWCIDHNVVVIPKSGNKNRIEENRNIFDFRISDDDIKLLDGF